MTGVDVSGVVSRVSVQKVARPRFTDAIRVVGSALGFAFAASLRRLFGRRRRPSWSWRLEATIAAQRGAWSVMPKIGVVRWRRVGDRMSPMLTDGLETAPIEGGGPAGLWLMPPEDRGRVVLYIHGGGFVFGSLRTHGNLIGGIARATSARALALEYRLAPEHPCPAALDDVLAAYRWLIDRGTEPQHIVLAGDSAGGNLVLSALLALRDRGEPLPAAGVAICPWVDLACSGESFERNRDLDFVGLEHCRLAADHYLAGADPRAPEISPLFAELEGLPPILVHAGGRESLVDQIRQFSERAEQAGVSVETRIHDEMVHVWHMFRKLTPEAQVALDEIGAFVEKTVADAERSTSAAGS